MAREVSTGQLIDTSDDRRFWFDAGATALDFVYTDEFATDFGTFVASVDPADWLRERFVGLDGDVGSREFAARQLGEREIADVEAVRASIRSLAVAIAADRELPSGDIDILNLYAATPDVPPVLAGGSRQAGRSSIRLAQALSSLAREAIRIFGPDERERVRQCAADDCQLVFYDDSRAGSRRWCSMQRCGNRAKVRAFRARA